MIDWQRIRELVDEFGADDFAEVVDLFLQEVEGAIDQLAESCGDPSLMAQHMHFLKGAALNLGFSELSDLCSQGESAAKAGSSDPAMVETVRRKFAESRVVFQRELPTRCAA